MTLGVIAHKRQKSVGNDGSTLTETHEQSHPKSETEGTNKMDVGPTETSKKSYFMFSNKYVMAYTVCYGDGSENIFIPEQ